MKMTTKQMTLPVQGMTCASCVGHVERALSGVPGVSRASVNLATEKATVEFDHKQAKAADLVAAVQDAGYDAVVEKITLPIGGMTCFSCVGHVERALQGVEGVLTANVNLATEKATVEYLPGVAGLPDFQRAVADVSYEVLEAPEEAATEGEEEIDQEEATSSITVVTNASRLRKLDIRPSHLQEAPKSLESEGVRRQAEAAARESFRIPLT